MSEIKQRTYADVCRDAATFNRGMLDLMAKHGMTTPPSIVRHAPGGPMSWDDDIARDVAELRRRMEGYGELLHPETVQAAWQAYCADADAEWLIVSDIGFGCFAGWLLGKWADGRKEGP